MADALPTRLVGKQTKLQAHDFQANGMAAGVASGSNAVATCTPAAGYRCGVEFIHVNYRTAVSTGSIQISDGTLTWGPFTIPTAGLVQINFPRPIMFTKSAQVTVTMLDGSVTKDLYVAFMQDGSDGGV